jgi:DNA-binding beta-propeller fold protein YncE
MKRKKSPIPKFIKSGRIILAACLFSLLITSSCDKDPEPDHSDFPRIIEGGGVFVINEGNFQSGNASLGYYDKQSGRMYNNLFFQANQAELGDILQSMVIHNGLAYLVVNNSGKIEVIDPFTCISQGKIDGLVSPRYLLPVSNTKAYVSNLFGGQLNVIDLHANVISSSIPLTGWNEELTMLSGMVVSAGVDTGHLYFIDPATDQLTDSLWVGVAPASFATDAQGHLWVLCAGDWMSNTGAALVQISRHNFGVLHTHMLPEIGQTYTSLGISPDGTTLYMIGNGVYSWNLLDRNPETEMLIPSSGRIFYGLSVDPVNGQIYVSDAVDFTQRGKVLIFDEEGREIGNADAMHNPGGFYFF